MKIHFLLELAFLGRLFIAGLYGAIIGYERNNRLKEAGTRTHLIVALAASLIMIVSKDGFADVTSYQGIALDPSRIAAQIVTGVGFLGAGMIFVRNQNISGLTTAAGVWATAGIGMCIGAGLYFLGIAATALVVIAQIVLHRQYTWAAFSGSRANSTCCRRGRRRNRLSQKNVPRALPRGHFPQALQAGRRLY